jgi:hypothetical protein
MISALHCLVGKRVLGNTSIKKDGENLPMIHIPNHAHPQAMTIKKTRLPTFHYWEKELVILLVSRP